MEQVEKELDQEKDLLHSNSRDWNEVPDNEIAEIPDIAIIKEEDRGTDMSDFEAYLKQTFGETHFTQETQTEKVIKKHVKVGVNTEKLGLLRDKQTFIDPRMIN